MAGLPIDRLNQHPREREPETPQERERDRDARRRSEQPWRAWYHLPIWDQLRAQQLARRPMCETCRRAPATVAHHKHPHRGVWELFADPNNLQSVCKRCHDGEIARGERAGNYATEINLNRGVVVSRNVLFPKDLLRSAIPLTLVCGAPGSGKSTYVGNHKQAGDIVIDIDAITAEIAGTSVRSNETRLHLQAAMIERNRRLQALARESRATRAWFIIGAPSGGERDRWAIGLGAERVIVIEAPADECIERINRDANRAPIADELARAVWDWWARYSPSQRDAVIVWEGPGQ
jgi:5-methylcytosine-specific restriction protein A